MESILTSIKTLLGPSVDGDDFDVEIIMFINSALSTLQQLDVGPSEGFRIETDEQTWEEFLGDSKIFEDVKEYVYLRVKTVFDPPANAYVMTAMLDKIKELEYRLNTKAETGV